MPKVAAKMDRAEMMKHTAETATPTKELERTTATAMILIAMAAAAIAMAAVMSATTDVENAARDCTRHGGCSRPEREPCERVVQSKEKCAHWHGAPTGVQIALSMSGGAPKKKKAHRAGVVQIKEAAAQEEIQKAGTTVKAKNVDMDKKVEEGRRSMPMDEGCRERRDESSWKLICVSCEGMKDLLTSPRRVRILGSVLDCFDED